MRPVNPHNSLESVHYESVSVVPVNSFELRPKRVAQYTLRHHTCVVVTECRYSSPF